MDRRRDRGGRGRCHRHRVRAFPWIALTLAFTFGFYGLVKRLGPSVDAVSGLTLESLWLVPVASVILVVVGTTTGLTMGSAGPWHRCC